jgi:hypothetical protein
MLQQELKNQRNSEEKDLKDGITAIQTKVEIKPKISLTNFIICLYIIFATAYIAAGIIAAIGFKPLKLDFSQPITKLSFLKADGQAIVNESGERVLLRGVNFGGWLLWEGCVISVTNCVDYPERKLRQELEARMSQEKVGQFFNGVLQNFVVPEDFRRLKKMGLNVVRLPFHYRYVRPNELTLLDEAVKWAKENGLYVILDMHAAPGAQAPAYFADSNGNAYLWEDKGLQEEFIVLWEILAKRYKDEPTVAGYEILNEPETDNGDLVRELYQKTIERIRQIDSRHIIFLNGNHYASDLSIFTPTPTDKNLVYVFHTYTETFKGLLEVIKENGYLEFQRRYQVPLMCNEFDQYPDFIKMFEEQNIHYAVWTFKSKDEPLPFYLMPKDNPWRRWIESLGVNKQAIMTANNFQDKVREIVEISALSSPLKEELLTFINSNAEPDGFKEIFTNLHSRYNNESGKLKEVEEKVRKLNEELIKAISGAWLDKLANSLNSMNKDEFDKLAQYLRTEYWQGGTGLIRSN